MTDSFIGQIFKKMSSEEKKSVTVEEKSSLPTVSEEFDVKFNVDTISLSRLDHALLVSWCRTHDIRRLQISRLRWIYLQLIGCDSTDMSRWQLVRRIRCRTQIASQRVGVSRALFCPNITSRSSRTVRRHLEGHRVPFMQLPNRANRGTGVNPANLQNRGFPPFNVYHPVKHPNHQLRFF